VEPDPFKLRCGDRTADAAYRVLAFYFHRLRAYETAVRAGNTPQNVHDMRVEVRRLRSALRLFRKVLPIRAAPALKEDLRQLAQVLGRVRDMDVCLLRLNKALCTLRAADRRRLAPCLRCAREQAHRARTAATHWLTGARYTRFTRRFMRFMQTPPVRRGKKTAQAGRRYIRRRWQAVRRAGAAALHTPTEKNLHRLRILCKRLRYACEFFTGIYGQPAARLAARATDMQNALGIYHDTVLTLRWLKKYAQRPTTPPAPTTLPALPHLQNILAHQIHRRKRQALTLYPRFAHRQTRRLIKNIR